MKSPQLLMHLLTGAIGLALGLTLAPKFRSEDANISEASAGNFTNQSTAQIGRSGTEAETKIPIRTRARERKEEPKSSEPHISMPLKNVVQRLKPYGRLSDLDDLEKALVLLGATEMEQEQILKLVEASKSEVLAAEKTHTKLAKVSDDLITFDTSGVSGPALEIANRTKDGIRASLSADQAEVLISAIDWEQTFPTSGEPITLSINRREEYGGILMMSQMQGSKGFSSGLGAEFVDDGRPLPAEKIFGDQWKPFLNGVTILPKGP